MSVTSGYVVHLAGCGLADVPAHDEWLTAAERAVLSGLTVAKRRTDWRLGRWCAKQAVAAQCGVQPTEVEILADADGAPVAWARVEAARRRDAGERQALASVSVTHRDGRAAAAAAPRTVRLGCDLERVEPRSEHFIRDYFTPAEAAAVLERTDRERQVLANLCWSAKEAVLKAARVGLRADTRTVAVCVPTSLEADAWQPLHARSASTGEYTGSWRLQGDWLLTVLADRPHRLQSDQSVF